MTAQREGDGNGVAAGQARDAAAEGTTELRTDVGFASMSLLAPPGLRGIQPEYSSLSLSLFLSLLSFSLRLSPSPLEESGTRGAPRNVAQGTLAGNSLARATRR